MKVTVYNPEGKPEEMTREEANEAINFRKYTWELKTAPAKTAYTAKPKQTKQYTSKVYCKVQDKKSGEIYSMLTVDAKEAVNTGHYELVQAEKGEAKADSSNTKAEHKAKLNAEQLREELKKMGVDFPTHASKAQLLLIYEEAMEAAEAAKESGSGDEDPNKTEDDQKKAEGE